MKKLTLNDLDDLAIGCTILGSGGGGDPTVPYMMAKYELEKHESISLIESSELTPESLILPLGFIGAPLAAMEKIASGREVFAIIDVLENILEKKIDVIMPFEIAGISAFLPLIVAAKSALPVLDADMMGRAFPEAQMSVANLMNARPCPGAVADCLGNTVIIQNARDSLTLEKLGRNAAVAMGSIGAFGFFPISGMQVSTYTIRKSISKALAIGKTYRETQKKGKNSLDAILKLCKGVFLGSGKITDIDRVISNGFLKGSITIQNKDETIKLMFQNEFLIAKLNEQIVATTPDILALFEQETAVPITCESLQYGIKVNLVALPAPEIWTSPAGLSLIGPRHFGYEVDYQPIKKNSTLKK